MSILLHRLLAAGCKTSSRLSSNSVKDISSNNVTYRYAKKKDKYPVIDLICKHCLMADPHYKGLGGSMEEAQAHIKYLVKDALRFRHTMLAYDKDRVVGVSLLNVRHRDPALNNLDILGPKPPTSPHFSMFENLSEYAQREFLKLNQSTNSLLFLYAFFVFPEYRRQGVASTLLKTQLEAEKHRNKETDTNTVVVLSTSAPLSHNLEKIGFQKAFELPEGLYCRKDGSRWEPAGDIQKRGIVYSKKL